MIRSSIQIENGLIDDFYDAFGFIYLDADKRTAPDEKQDAVTSYAEEPREHRDGRTCYAPFDYTAKFLIEAPNLDLPNVNTKITAFNEAIREQIPGSELRRKKSITFYNYKERVKIVGYPELVAQPTELYRSPKLGMMEAAVVELKIRVDDPTKCDFCLKNTFPA